MVKVFRFSQEGWKPQSQEHHLEQAKQASIDIIEDVNKFTLGVWVFVQINRKKFYLNHLEEASLYPCVELELPDDTMAFIGHKIFEKSGWMSLRSIKDLEIEIAYLPNFVYEKFLKQGVYV